METFFGYFFPKKVTYCLNRTMQYGNEKSRHTEIVGTDSLNRTMQYGNFKTESQKSGHSSV